jgi:alpha-1,2-mannosyltransferase
MAIGVGSAMTLAVAGDTLGYDFTAYHRAAVRVLAGGPAYDLSFEVAGVFGLFFYPPTFVPLVLAFGALPLGVATWAWTGLLGLALGAGILALPVRRRTRWWIVLLAGQSWPLLYALKLGQVGPLLFVLFAVGWRWLDRPLGLGASGALGAAIKLQPGIVLAWAVLTRRWAAVAAGAAVLVVLAIAATVVAGTGSWADFLGLLGRVSDPIATPHNFTPGAVAYQLGMGRDAAAILQWAAMAMVVVVVVIAALALDAAPSYLVAVVASQLLSPILWDHYAMLLLLPVAWLIDRGHGWAALVPLATSIVFVGATPAITYPAAFAATLAALLAVGIVDRRARTGRRAAVPSGLPA